VALDPHWSYTPELAAEIIERLADGETLRTICRDDHIPTERSVRRWAMADIEGFAARFSQARELGYLAMADEILEVADDGRNDWTKDDEGYKVNGENIARSRLRVDTRKWILAKCLPKVFGEKITQSVQQLDENGNPTAPRAHVTIEFLGDPAPGRSDPSHSGGGLQPIGGVDLVG
jgi:hypothetical protein